MEPPTLGQKLEVGKLVDDGHEDVVLRLLLTGKLVEGHDAGVRLGGGVFHFAIDPAFLDLLLHPGNVGCLGSEVAHRMEVNPHPSGSPLPFGGVLPGGLAEVAQGGTVGGVDFVANLGDLFVVHGFPFRGMGRADGQVLLSFKGDGIVVVPVVGCVSRGLELVVKLATPSRVDCHQMAP